MELRSRLGISGSQTKPRVTSVDRKREKNSLDDTITTLLNRPSSATGITRGGKSPSRILPAEGGRIRTSSPQPRSESAGGADRSPEGDPPPSPRANPGKRRRGRESYARSTTSSRSSDRRETYPTPRRRCRIYTCMHNLWLVL